MTMKKVLVVGIGYVGISLLLSMQGKAELFALDKDEAKIKALKEGSYSIVDPLFKEVFPKAPKIDGDTKYPDREVDYIFFALPTDYKEELGGFDTKVLDQELAFCAKKYPNAALIIKSTVPLGYTEERSHLYPHLFFCPEFLRETTLLKDAFYPTRLILGFDSEADEGLAKEVLNFLLLTKKKGDVPTILCKSKEAEAIKLFSNEYLAMRIAYFNELDSYALKKGLDASTIIKGVSLDPRIGNYYNNPSFGYGGYCLPKDTKALLSSYGDIPEELLSSVIASNAVRKKIIAEDIRGKANGKTIGIYRLTMKSGSDNFRSSSVLDLMEELKDLPLIIYEPSFKEDSFQGVRVEKDLGRFLKESGLILANRVDSNLKPVMEKVYTRDLTHED